MIASGCEWIVEAHGCSAPDLANEAKLRGLFAHLIAEMDLHTVAEAAWHQFPGTGGLTGVSLLRESHIACHTFPEYGSLCLNVFCCRPRVGIDLETHLKQEFGATSVQVRRIERPYGTE